MTVEGTEVVDCSVCGPAPSRVWLDDGLPTRYRACRRCGTVFASPRASRASRWASLTSTYSVGEFACANATRRQPVLEAEARFLKMHVSEGVVLDVGCDLGHLFAHFSGERWTRLGVELSPSAAAAAASSYDADVRVGDLRSAAWDASSIDLLTMMDMFYFSDDPRAELAEAARVLRPGGCLALEFPGQRRFLLRSRGPLCWLLERKWSRLKTDSAYLYLYTPRALVRLVEAAGLTATAVCVVPTPLAGRWGRDIVGRSQCAVALRPNRWLLACVTWAPKYLLVARKPATAVFQPANVTRAVRQAEHDHC